MKSKKLVCLVAAVVMSLSSVSALAEVTVPIPENNNQAFDIADNLVKKGLYYEAMQELGLINPNEPYYDAAKVQAWKSKIQTYINRYEMDLTLSNISKAYKAKDAELMKYYIDQLNANPNKTENDYYKLRDWNSKYEYLLTLDKVKTKKQAQNAVIAEGFYLKTSDERYCTIDANVNEFHVYIQTKVPKDGYSDVAAFRVNKHTGVVKQVQ